MTEWSTRMICGYVGASAGVWMDAKDGPNPLVQSAQEISIFPDEDRYDNTVHARAQGGVMSDDHRMRNNQIVTPDNEVIGVPAGTQPVPNVGETVAPSEASDDEAYDRLPEMDAVMRLFGPPLPPRE